MKKLNEIIAYIKHWFSKDKCKGCKWETLHWLHCVMTCYHSVTIAGKHGNPKLPNLWTPKGEL